MQTCGKNKPLLQEMNIALMFFSGWSAPSAIGLAGLGGGFEIGMEVSGVTSFKRPQMFSYLISSTVNLIGCHLTCYQDFLQINIL